MNPERDDMAAKLKAALDDRDALAARIKVVEAERDAAEEKRAELVQRLNVANAHLIRASKSIVEIQGIVNQFPG